MKKFVVLLAVVLAVSGCTSQGETGPESQNSTLIGDIRSSEVIAWVAPHCDDEIFASEVLALASLGYGKEVYSVSLAEGASAFPPGATLADRHQDNEEFREYLELADYVRLGISTYPDPEKKRSLFGFLDGFQPGLDMIMTFENTHGGNGMEEHVKVSGWLTEYAKSRGVTLYYVINRDPIIGDGMDPLPYTDTIDLDNVHVTLDGKRTSLWDVNVGVLEIYKSSVPSALGLLKPQRLAKVQHAKFYRKVN